jgi:threonine aldolase
LDVAFLSEPVTNQVFPILGDAHIDALRKLYGCHVWSRVDAGHSVIRLVAAWATQRQHVDMLIDDLRALRA